MKPLSEEECKSLRAYVRAYAPINAVVSEEKALRMLATIDALRAENKALRELGEKMRHVGGQMANVCRGFGQLAWDTTGQDRQNMSECYRKWDEIDMGALREDGK